MAASYFVLLLRAWPGTVCLGLSLELGSTAQKLMQGAPPTDGDLLYIDRRWEAIMIAWKRVFEIIIQCTPDATANELINAGRRTKYEIHFI